MKLIDKDAVVAEIKRKIKEIDEILASKSWDYRKAEAVSQWQKAHEAESKYKNMK